MNKLILFFFIPALLVSSIKTQAQSAEGFKRNTVFAEFSSRRPVYSLNYDRIFYTGPKLALSYRAGIHILSDEAGIPISLSLLTGTKSDHHAELSLSVMPYIDRVNYLFREGNYSDKYIYLTPGIGYRYQRAAGGFFLKALIAPQIVLDPRSDNFWAMDPVTYIIGSVGAGFSF